MLTLVGGEQDAPDGSDAGRDAGLITDKCARLLEVLLTGMVALVQAVAMPAVPAVTPDPPSLRFVQPAPRRRAINRDLIGLLPAWERDLAVRLETSPVETRKALASVRRFIKDGRAYDADADGSRPILVAADFTAKGAIQWLTGLIETGGDGAKKTVKNHLSRLRGFAAFLITEGEIPKGQNPFEGIKLPSAPRRKGAHPFSAAEVRRLIKTARKREAASDQASRNGPLASTYYELLALTGLRRAESKHQAWEDIDLDLARMILTKDKARRNDPIPLNEEAVELLREWRPYSIGPMLFPRSPSHNTLNLDMEAAGIEKQADGRTGQWHRFRKCAITEWARAGATLRDLHKFARHASVDMTMQHYDLPEVEELRAVAEIMPKLRDLEGKALDKRRQIPHTDVAYQSQRTPRVAQLKSELDSGGRPQPASSLGTRMTSGVTPLNTPFRASARGRGDVMEPGGIEPPLTPPVSDAELLNRLLAAHERLIALAEQIAGERAGDRERDGTNG